MRISTYLLSTVKETPADAEIASHRLMLRAGLIRRVASGLYTWLPLGLRVLRRVEGIVREEMDAAGALELSMPAVQPSELWQESGRWEQYGPELLRFHDRHNRDFCLGPTHEEVITALVRNEIQSYRQLPTNFYQIQTKFRDEIRPRFGVMRAREFLMKDAYSFHLDQESLQDTYQLMHDTYTRIFTRLGLAFRPVAADSGSIGGSTSHEFHVLADSGEDSIAICDKLDYAANVELAEAVDEVTVRPEPRAELDKVDTPGQHTIGEVSDFLGVSREQTIKTMLVNGRDGIVALVLRGDHELNLVKAEKHPLLASPLTFADEAEILAAAGCNAGSIGPVGLEIPVIADRSAALLADFTCGANEDDKHLTGVNWVRDLPEPEEFDLRNVQEGDLCVLASDSSDPEARLTIKRGIEVGHIFQLGTKYSEAMNATCLDQNGRATVMPMGCYGIGVSRIVAAAIEQNHDDAGIIWPAAMAPFEVIIIPIGMHKSDKVRDLTEDIYTNLGELGVDVLLDDRNERPGIMFADAELIGIPHRLVIGDRGLEKGMIEYKSRSGPKSLDLEISGIIDTLQALIR